MASKYIKTFNPKNNIYIPTFLNNHDLMQLILENSDGFLFIVNCHCGRITFTSESILNILNCNKKEWIGASIYDKIYVDDIENMKLQLSIKPPRYNWCNEPKPYNKQRQECLQRDFICRMKTGNNESKRRKRDSYIYQCRELPHYVIVRCNGFIKKEQQNESYYFSSCVYSPKDDETSAYLVATARLELYSVPYNTTILNMKMEFSTRLNVNGVYIFVDEQIRSMLPYAAKDLLGKNFQMFCHPLDRPLMCEYFKQTLHFKGQHMTVIFRFKVKENWISMRATMYGFVNHWSSSEEFIVCTYSIVNQAVTNDFYLPSIVQDAQISSSHTQNVDFRPFQPNFQTCKVYDNLPLPQSYENGQIFSGATFTENLPVYETIDLTNSSNFSWDVPAENKTDSKILIKTETEENSEELSDILSVLKTENSAVFGGVFNDSSTTINEADLIDF